MWVLGTKLVFYTGAVTALSQSCLSSPFLWFLSFHVCVCVCVGGHLSGISSLYHAGSGVELRFSLVVSAPNG